MIVGLSIGALASVGGRDRLLVVVVLLRGELSRSLSVIVFMVIVVLFYQESDSRNRSIAYYFGIILLDDIHQSRNKRTATSYDVEVLLEDEKRDERLTLILLSWQGSGSLLCHMLMLCEDK